MVSSTLYMHGGTFYNLGSPTVVGLTLEDSTFYNLGSATVVGLTLEDSTFYNLGLVTTTNTALTSPAAAAITQATLKT